MVEKITKGTWKKKKSDSKRKFKWFDKKILVVEDEKSNHMLIDLILRPTSARLLWAMDGEKAVELAQENPDIDLILMDIRLPKMDGYEATKKIREFNQSVPIIAQTAYVMEEEKYKVTDVGCDDLLTKPLQREKMLKMIDKYMKKKN
ncbi:MAG TPA: response regulator [Bacteroidia bacterium]|nr:response regulator [Bacteroidia bacterium]HRS57931.1 response regulator [Bacteroidia bacterium]HRU67974.1 response regulator [Bacteroidia bacterium]